MSQAEVLQAAIVKAGSGRALAEILEQHETAVSNWKRGRPIPDDVLAYLAKYVGEDPLQVLAKEKGGLWPKLRDSAAEVALLTAVAIPIIDSEKLSMMGNQLGLCIMSTCMAVKRHWRYLNSLVRLRTFAPQLPHLVESSSWRTACNASA